MGATMFDYGCGMQAPNPNQITIELLHKRVINIDLYLSPYYILVVEMDSQKPIKYDLSPPERRNLISRWLFWYILPVLRKGVKTGAINLEDIHELDAQHSPWKLFLKFSEGDENFAESILLRIVTQNWRYMLASFIFLFINTLAALFQPLALEATLNYFSLRNPDEKHSPYYGYYMSGGLGLSVLAQALTMYQFWQTAAVVGLRSQQILSEVVLAKTLSLSPASDIHRGKLLTHMTIDAPRMADLMFFPFSQWATWSAIITISAAAYKLYTLLGWSSMVGIATLLLLIPASSGLSRYAKTFSQSLQKKREGRVRVINEALTGIQTLKAYGWVNWFIHRIHNARIAEVEVLTKRQYLNSFAEFIGFCTPLIMATSSLIVYSYCNTEKPLTATIVFSVMSWYTLLSAPVKMIPSFVTNTIDVLVSVRRLKQFFNTQGADISSLSEWKNWMQSYDHGKQVRDALTDTKPDLESSRGFIPPSYSDLSSSFLNEESGRPWYMTLGWVRVPTLWTQILEKKQSMQRKNVPRRDSRSNEEPLLQEDYLTKYDEGPSSETVSLTKISSGSYLPGKPQDLLGATTPAVEVSDATFGWVVNIASGSGESHSPGQSKEQAHAESQVANGVSSTNGTQELSFFQKLFRTARAMPLDNNHLTFTPILKNITFTCPPGTVTLIMGPPGVGKSTLLSGLVGAAVKSDGFVSLNGSLSVATQNPWLQTLSIKENICFVTPYESSRFQRVLQATGLHVDMHQFPLREDTIIGESGATVSGGQRARIDLARALYAHTEIVILDDILSALDARVARHVWTEAVSKFLLNEKRTVLMATHASNYATAPEVYQVVNLHSDGTLTITPGRNANMNLDDAPLIANSILLKENDALYQPDDSVTDLRGAASSVDASGTGLLTENVIPKTLFVPDDNALKASNALGDKIQNEEVAKGLISFSHLRTFLRAAGPWYIHVAIVLIFFLGQALQLGAFYWLSIWTSTNEDSCQKATGIAKIWCGWTYVEFSSVCIGINVALASLVLSRLLLVTKATIAGGSILHLKAIIGVFGSPASYFAANPVGRIINRFFNDQRTIDETLRSTFGVFMLQLVASITTLSVLVMNIPYTLIAIVILGYFYYKIALIYRITARDLRRLMSTAKSPIYSYFSEVTRNVAFIRAYGPETCYRLIQRQTDLMVTQSRTWLAYYAASQWVSLFLELFGAIIILWCGLFSVWQYRRSLGSESSSGNVSAAGQVGFLLSTSLSLPISLRWLVRTFSALETDAICIERLAEFGSLPSEDTLLNDVRNDTPQKYSSKNEVLLAQVLARINKEKKERVVKNSYFYELFSNHISGIPLLLQDVWLRYADGLVKPEKVSQDQPNAATPTVVAKSPSLNMVGSPFPPSPLIISRDVTSPSHTAQSEGETVLLGTLAPTEWSLRGASLTIPAGAKVAIVGRTGAGKSSLVQALLRAYPFAHGEIFANEHNIRSSSAQYSRTLFSASLQDSFLFTGSVLENLLGPRASFFASCEGQVVFGVDSQGHAPHLPSTVSEEQLFKILKQLQLTSLLETLGKGLHGQIDDGGGRLSSGERSLLCLARLFLRQAIPLPIIPQSKEAETIPKGMSSRGDAYIPLSDGPISAPHYDKATSKSSEVSHPDMLSGAQIVDASIEDYINNPNSVYVGLGGPTGLVIVDEPSASLDKSYSKIIHEALLSTPATVIVICHGLEHIQDFDLVAVMDQGKCVEFGTPSALLQEPTSHLSTLAHYAKSASAPLG